MLAMRFPQSGLQSGRSSILYSIMSPALPGSQVPLSQPRRFPGSRSARLAGPGGGRVGFVALRGVANQEIDLAGHPAPLAAMVAHAGTHWPAAIAVLSMTRRLCSSTVV